VATPSNFPFPCAYRRDTAQGQNRGRESSKKGTVILALGKAEAIQIVILRAIFALYPSWSSGGTIGSTSRRNLW